MVNTKAQAEICVGENGSIRKYVEMCEGTADRTISPSPWVGLAVGTGLRGLARGLALVPAGGQGRVGSFPGKGRIHQVPWDIGRNVRERRSVSSQSCVSFCKK